MTAGAVVPSEKEMPETAFHQKNVKAAFFRVAGNHSE
jgi:hypothetical protein